MNNPWAEKTNFIWTSTWTPEMQVKPIVIYFRKKLEIDAMPKRLIVQISADSRYSFMVNGKKVCCGPCKGNEEVWYYEEVDLVPYLTQGENILAAIVLRYPLAHPDGNLSVIRTSVPNFYLKEKNEKNESKLGVSADRSWKTFVCEGLYMLPENENSRYLWNKEYVDGGKLPYRWEYPSFDDTDWQEAFVYKSGQVPRGKSPRTLRKRPIPLLSEIKKTFNGISVIRKSEDLSIQEWESMLNRNKTICLSKNTTYVVEIDAGELMTGYLNIHFQNGQGSKVEILISELYEIMGEDGHYHKMDRTDCVKGVLRGYIDTYTVGGYGKEKHDETYEPFWFKTFRYIQLKIKVEEEPLIIQSFTYRETGYPLDVQTHVTVSDQEMMQITDISLRTLKRCMHETYEDCPFYEQLQYAMDARTQILFTYAIAADDRLARKCINDIHSSLRSDGLTNCCFPSSGPNVIPGFSLYYIYMLHDHMMYFGDKDFIKRFYYTAEQIVGFFERHMRNNGLLGKIGYYNGMHEYWSFIDWTTKWKWGVPNAIKNGPLTMESLLYLMSLQMMSEIADYIGRTSDAQYYHMAAEKLKQAVRINCYDKEKRLYQDGPGYNKDYSQHTQVFAILTGVEIGEKAQNLMKQVIKDDTLAKCSVAMSFYYFRALEKTELYNEYSYDQWDLWREMLKNNLTTCVESPGESRSECHAWGACALYEIPSVILGVRPAAPGYQKAYVQPHPTFIDSAAGSVITPKGKIHVKWKKENDKVILDTDTRDFSGEILMV